MIFSWVHFTGNDRSQSCGKLTHFKSLTPKFGTGDESHFSWNDQKTVGISCNIIKKDSVVQTCHGSNEDIRHTSYDYNIRPCRFWDERLPRPPCETTPDRSSKQSEDVAVLRSKYAWSFNSKKIGNLWKAHKFHQLQLRLLFDVLVYWIATYTCSNWRFHHVVLYNCQLVSIVT